MKIAVSGVTGLRNRGVDALVTSTLAGARSLVPGCRFAVVTDDPEYDAPRFAGSGATTHAEWSLPGRARRAAQKYLGLQPKAPASVIEALDGANVLVVSGGDLFSSDYGSFDRLLETPRVAIAHGVPVVFLGQSVGPFRTRAQADAWCRIARRAALITVRESLSRDYVVEQLNIPASSVLLGSDIAFSLEAMPAESARRALSAYGVTRPFAVVAPSQGISRYSASNAALHADALAACIRVLLEECGTEVALIPHVQERHRWNDDRVLATELWRRLSFDPRVHLVGGDHTASEFKGLIGQAEILVSERMHASIAGMSMTVPTLTVGYSVKARGIHADVYGAGAEYGESLIELATFLGADSATNAVRSLWRGRQRHAAHLAAHRARLIDSARSTLAEVFSRMRAWN